MAVSHALPALLAIARLQSENIGPDPWAESPFAHWRRVAERDPAALELALEALAVVLAAHGLACRATESPGVFMLERHQVEAVVLVAHEEVELEDWVPMPDTVLRLFMVVRPQRVEVYCSRARPRARTSFREPPEWMAGGTLPEGLDLIRDELERHERMLLAKASEAKK